VAQASVGRAEFAAYLLGHRALGEQGADLPGGVVIVVVRSAGGEGCELKDAAGDPVGVDKVLVGRRGEHEARRHLETGPGQLAEVGALAACLVQIAASQLVKVLDVGHDLASLLPGSRDRGIAAGDPVPALHPIVALHLILAMGGPDGAG
jgi:hypothetical protein